MTLYNDQEQSIPDRDTEETSFLYYPEEIKNDLEAVDLPQSIKNEVLTCAYQYTRCVIPNYCNRRRYFAFMRAVIIATIAEFRGELVDITTGDHVLGHSVGKLMEDLFENTGVMDAMSREFRTFLLFTADKTSERREGELYRRYRAALAYSPEQWFRMRDADALVRFSIAAALACNDRNIACWTGKFEVLAEIAITLYDAVAFRKHKTEGEICSTFAYVPCQDRTEAFKRARDVLWSLDANSDSEDTRIVINFIRALGGPIHMTMHRYRFVEEDLTIGRPENDEVKALAHQNAKLWFRDGRSDRLLADDRRYEYVMSQRKQLLFSGLGKILADSRDTACSKCHQICIFNEGGMHLCKGCERVWRVYLEMLPARVLSAFPGRKVESLICDRVDSPARSHEDRRISVS